jgi:sodium-dependent dicarboxylate transporter 2/3/5
VQFEGDISFLDWMTYGVPAAPTSSLAFILVTSSPTNVIPYSAGYFRIKDMALAGLAMTAVGSVILSVSMYVIGRFTGLY